eukprot:1210694-Heterocapsa_arctica.AAC.1
MTVSLTVSGLARTVKQKDQSSTRGTAHMVVTNKQMKTMMTVDTGIKHIKTDDEAFCDEDREEENTSAKSGIEINKQARKITETNQAE